MVKSGAMLEQYMIKKPAEALLAAPAGAFGADLPFVEQRQPIVGAGCPLLVIDGYPSHEDTTTKSANAANTRFYARKPGKCSQASVNGAFQSDARSTWSTLK